MIRPVAIADVNPILTIYSHYVENTAITFETVSPDRNEMEKRIRETIERYPWLVFEKDGVVIGYAYAHAFAARAAYRFSVESSIYFHKDWLGYGFGKEIYKVLLEEIKKMGYYTVYAGITVPNERSISLHKSLGFHEIGVNHHAGYKFGDWRSVARLELPLREYDKPEEPCNFPFVELQK